MSDIPDCSNLRYDEQLAAKADWLRELLAPFTNIEAEIFRSAEHSYRMRCEFHAWHQGDELEYAMYEPGTRKTYGIRDFSPASKAIRALMPRLLEALKNKEILRRRLFRIEFLSTTTEEILVSLIYHKPIDETWREAAQQLAEDLEISLIGRSKKKKIQIGDDFVTETLQIGDTPYLMRQIEGTFTQPNAMVNQQMVLWACQQAESHGGDLLELYCGNGNFTLPLSKHFGKVLATEISKGSIAALNWNLEANQISNIALARLSAEEVTEALARVRRFRRLRDIDLDSYNFSTIFVDPPRAGVGENTMELVRQFDNIIYISCNPETLKNNLEQIADSHRVCALAAFDQFPYTPHLEAGVVLKKQ